MQSGHGGSHRGNMAAMGMVFVFFGLLPAMQAGAQRVAVAANCEIPKAFVEKCLRTAGYPGDTKLVACAADGRPLCCYQRHDGSQACSTDPGMKITGPQYPGPHMPLPVRPRPPVPPSAAPK